MPHSASTYPLLIRNARLAFVEVFEPKAVTQDVDPVYSLTALLDPNDPENRKAIETIRKEAAALMQEVCGSTQIQIEHRCFGWADEDGMDFEGFKGMFYIHLENKRRPLALDRDMTLIAANDNTLYSGCYGNVSFSMCCKKSSEFGKSLNGNLHGVQFMRDGGRFIGIEISGSGRNWRGKNCGTT